MKKILAVLMLTMLTLCVRAASPTFQTFSNSSFVINQAANTITVNTNGLGADP